MAASETVTQTFKPTTLVTTGGAVVTGISDSGSISPDPEYRNSFVVIEVDRQPKPNSTGYFVYCVRWLMSGRHQATFSTVDFTYTAKPAARVDVPIGSDVTDEYLEKALNEFVHGGGGLPEDTVVIRK